MDWGLTVIIITWVITLWCVFIIGLTFYAFSVATPFEKKYSNITLGKELFGTITGISILVGYYFG